MDSIRDAVKLEAAQADALRCVLLACKKLMAEVERVNAALPWSVAVRVEELDVEVDAACRRLMERIDGAKLVPPARLQ